MQLRQDPRLLELIIVMPMVLQILFGVALKLEPQNVKMAYVDEQSSYFIDMIKPRLWTEGYFELYKVDSKLS